LAVSLTRLRIAGFKSFAEPTTVEILPGLTGIVGPNGCGKSNVVEALRWAMGENSARSLRGGEMDDVIFAGTTARASRNLAEVGITLVRGEDAPLPDPFGAEPELVVSRRIERGAGSAYRANGREMRARDVQTLYADLASGARSCAMVSQGRVAALVNARPDERRGVLEEAAGITGLHARRHEAELKLRAAEANLSKAEDLRTQLDQGREGLRRQAKQAARYRAISGLVRNAEVEFFAARHARAQAALIQARAAAELSAEQVAAAAEHAVLARAAREAAEAALPAPREREAEARSRLERRRLEAETLADEAARAAASHREAEERLAQIEADLEGATHAATDAGEALARLTAETDALSARLADLPHAQAEAASLVEQAAATLADAEKAASLAARLAVEAAAAEREAARTLAAAQARLDSSTAACAAAEADVAAAEAMRIPPDHLAAAGAARRRAEAALAACRGGLDDALTCRDQAAAAHAAAATEAERAVAASRAAAVRLADSEARSARAQSALESVQADLSRARELRPDDQHIANLEAALAEAVQWAEVAEADMAESEKALNTATSRRLTCASHRDQLAGERQRAEAELLEAERRLEAVTGEYRALQAAIGKLAVPEALAQCMTEAKADAAAREAAAAEADARFARLEEGRALADQALTAARADLSAAEAQAARLLAEMQGLRQALAAQAGGGEDLLDRLSVPAGLERAVGAALGDTAGCEWRALPPLPQPVPPPGGAPLVSVVEAPPELARVMSHAAVLDDGADGTVLQAGLPPGFVLVTRAGDAWRWDGCVRHASAVGAAASRLEQRRRVAEVEALHETALNEAANARRSLAFAEAALAEAAGFEAAAREARAAAEQALVAIRRDLAAVQAEHARLDAELAARRPALARLAEEQTARQERLEQARHTLGAINLEAAEQALADARAAEKAAQARLAQARVSRDGARKVYDDTLAGLQKQRAAVTAAESKIAALTPQRMRLEHDVEEAGAALAEAVAAIAALPEVASLEAAAEEARRRFETASEAVTGARLAVEAAEAAHRDTVEQDIALQQKAAETEHALAARRTVLAGCVAARDADQAASAEAARVVAEAADAQALADSADEAARRAAEARASHAAAAASLAALQREADEASRRLPLLCAECDAWAQRAADASRRQDDFRARLHAARDAVALLGEAPADLAERAARSGDALAEAEAHHASCQQALAAAEEAVRRAALGEREAESGLAALREAAARGEGTVEAASGALRDVLMNAAERLGADAELPEAEASEAAEDKARRKLDRLTREREEMGPVNLRADIELEEMDARIDAIDREREDLTAAIAKLRGSIGHLNREGRERLTAVFTEVDRHFRTLFTRMMGGGRAHLALVGSEDPLEAGLEIYAEPPGKKLAALSLLSGGEQALTALSLIFAVFRCTPAPVAVLDEVDAPLDDANVDRFCSLLDDVVRDTGTRFLVVTHHQLTMSRMDRLYGVTMQERGVSRILSVDLRRAAEMVEQPTLQAAE
jgi:chromosome segregation protein